MAQVIIAGGNSGGITSDDVTATRAQILEGFTDIAQDTDDEIAVGTLPKASVLTDNGGLMPNNGATGSTLGIDGTYTIPYGFTSGGTVNVQIPHYNGAYN